MSKLSLPNRAFMRLHGPDAARYLNGQITQKVASADQTKTLWTAVTNAKGGIEGVGCIQQLPDGSYLFDCPIEIGDDMEARLDKYLIADDCEWSREDDRWMIVFLEDGEEITNHHTTVSNRYRTPKTEALIDLSKTNNCETSPLSDKAEDEWCAYHAVPRWNREIVPGKLPAEQGLYDLCLSFDKGCYIGQEIISRMEAAGKTRTKLYQVTSATELSATDYTTIANVEGTNYGLVVSKAPPEAEHIRSF